MKHLCQILVNLEYLGALSGHMKSCIDCLQEHVMSNY